MLELFRQTRERTAAALGLVSENEGNCIGQTKILTICRGVLLSPAPEKIFHQHGHILHQAHPVQQQFWDEMVML